MKLGQVKSGTWELGGVKSGQLVTVSESSFSWERVLDKWSWAVSVEAEEVRTFEDRKDKFWLGVGQLVEVKMKFWLAEKGEMKIREVKTWKMRMKEGDDNGRGKEIRKDKGNVHHPGKGWLYL